MDNIIQKFGGIRPMAAKLAVPVSTVKSWKDKGVAPGWRHDAILAAAERNGITMSREDLAA